MHFFFPLYSGMGSGRGVEATKPDATATDAVALKGNFSNMLKNAFGISVMILIELLLML